MTHFQSWLSQERDFPPTTIRQRYAILSSERSGSTLLGECLRALGAGDPIEYLHRGLLQAFRQSAPDRGKATYGDLLTAMEKRRTTPNGTFGVKAHFFQFAEAFGSSINSAGPEWLRRQGTLIRIYRKDHLAQSISRMKASVTDQWHSTDKPTRAFAFSGRPLDYLNLVHHLNAVVKDELHWVGFCEQYQLKTFEVSYEDLRDNLRPTLGMVLNRIGLPDSSADLVEPPIRALANSQSAEVRTAFLEYLTGEPTSAR